MFVEKVDSGWAAWGSTLSGYSAPHISNPILKPWDAESEDAIAAVREVAKDATYWKDLSIHFTAETHAESVTSDNISSVKSIGQWP